MLATIDSEQDLLREVIADAESKGYALTGHVKVAGIKYNDLAIASLHVGMATIHYPGSRSFGGSVSGDTASVLSMYLTLLSLIKVAFNC